MKVLDNIRFFDATEDSQESEVLKIQNFCSILTIQVDGNADDFSIRVEGCTNNESTEFYDIAVINNSTFEATDRITTNGVYSVGVDGYSRIKLDLEKINNGYVSAFGKIGD